MQSEKADVSEDTFGAREPFLIRQKRRFYTWRWHTATVYLITLILIIASGLAAWLAYRSQAEQSPFLGEDSTNDDPASGSGQDGVGVLGTLQAIDTTSSTITILWQPIGYGTFTSDANDTQALNQDVSIFNDNTLTPVMRVLGNQSANGIAVTYRQTLNLQAYRAHTRDIDVASTITYPFDQYSAGTLWAATTSGNVSVPILQVALLGNIQGWTTVALEASSAYVGLSFSTESGARYIGIGIGRVQAVQAFAIIIACVMWLAAGTMVYLALLGTVFGRALPPNMLAVPATVLFALPALRNTMPNVPPFGTYLDYWTLVLGELVTALAFIGPVIVYMKRINLPYFPAPKKV